MKILAKDDSLNQSQIARKLRVTQGVARSYLNALIDVDLLYEKKGYYFFKDKVMPYWLFYRELGIELDESKKKILENIIKELEEKYLRVCTELVKAKESEIREKLTEKLGIKFSLYLKNNTEFDGVCVENNCVIILDVKWRNKPSDYEDIENFLKKTEKSKFFDKEKKLFFISKSGFTSSD